MINPILKLQNGSDVRGVAVEGVVDEPVTLTPEFVAQGAIAIDCSMATTPAMFMSLVYPETKYDGSMMITASHLPFNRNGIKFFEPENGGMEKKDLTDMLNIACELTEQTADISNVEKFDLVSLYAENLCTKIRQL